MDTNITFNDDDRKLIASTLLDAALTARAYGDALKRKLDGSATVFYDSAEKLTKLSERFVPHKPKEKTPEELDLERRRREDFDFMVVCASKGNMAMYHLLRDTSLDNHGKESK